MHYFRFQDSVNRLMKMTNEQKDLRSGLLFEQAAYCHLLTKPNPLVRKYAFHIILAGFRFAKAGQKEHAIRTYQQGCQILEKRGWKVAEEHILYTLGHQALLMKDFDVAVNLFNDLLSGDRVPCSNSLQQMCHLREFFIVHHMREKEAGRSSAAEAGTSNRRSSSALLTVPLFRAQQSVVDLTCRDWSGGDIMGLEKVHSDWNWQPLEKVIRDNARGREILTTLPTCQPVFTAASNNSLAPQATVGEVVRVVIPVENRFQTALLLKNVQLTWKFKKRGADEDWVRGETLSSEQQAQIISLQAVPKFNLERNSTARIVLAFVPQCAGSIMVTGVEYSMRAQFPQTVDTDYTIRGMQEFSLRGPRLKATKEQRTTVSYGQDLRLHFEVGEHRPRLDVQLKMPDAIFQGEVRKLNMTLANKGKVPLKDLVLVHCKPGMFSVRGEGNSNKDAPLFDLPIVRDPTLKEARDDGAEQVSLPLDFLRLPDNKLKAEESRNIPIWMRAPEQVGRYDMKLYFYYQRDDEAAETKLGERIFATSCQVKVLPLVTASASLKPVDTFANERRDALTIHISGVGKEAGAAQTERIVVAQVALVSHHRILSSASSVKKKSVHKLDSSCMTLQVKEVPQASESKVNVSSISLPDCPIPSAHHRPQLDFLKNGFGDSVRGRPAALAQDLVSVFWQQNPSAVARTQEVIGGQLVVPLRRQLSNSSSSSSHDEVDSASPSSQWPSPHVSVDVQVSSRIDHDFLKSGGLFCVVPCTLTITTSTAVSSPVVVKTSVSEDAEVDEGCSLVGVRSGEHRLNPGQTVHLSVGVMVTAPGVYQSTAFSLKTRLEEEGKQTSGRRRKEVKAPEDRAVPVKMCFFVRQVQKA